MDSGIKFFDVQPSIMKLVVKITLETMARHEASQKQPPGVKQSGSLSEQH